jgi:polyisoprenoid-binding protein YceI
MMRASWLLPPLIAVAASTAARAAAPDRPIRPESRVWISGASNIRHFTCKARALSGAIELRGVAAGAPVLAGENTSAAPSVSVTVDKLDCGIGIMNRHLRDALRGALHPRIDFRLATYEVDLRAATPSARIAGLVTIAGVQRPVTAIASVHTDSLGTLHVSGAYVIRPTEFGVAPPRRFAGLLRVRDRVTVHFDVALDADGGAVDDISCSVAQCCDAACTCCPDSDLKPETTHDSHH